MPLSVAEMKTRRWHEGKIPILTDRIVGCNKAGENDDGVQEHKKRRGDPDLIFARHHLYLYLCHLLLHPHPRIRSHEHYVRQEIAEDHENC